MSTTTITANLEPLEQADRKAALRQLERLLVSSHFRGSRRSSAFLQYVVEKSVGGGQESLKERTIGIDVFHREPGFDTSSDCIVRVVASEVRKRMAQYYQEPGHEDELHLELPPGAYVPHFRSPHVEVSVHPPKDVTPQAVTPKIADRPKISIFSGHRRILLTLVVALATFSLLGFRYWSAAESRSDLLSPFVKSDRPVTICVASPELQQSQPGANGLISEAALGQPPTNNALIPLADAMALSRVQAILYTHHQTSQVLLADTATFDTLRFGPSIMIGALDNPWTMRLTQEPDHQFYFKGTDTSRGEIVDRKSKSDHHWSVDFSTPYVNRTNDYAIVSITQDPTLGRPLLVLAGTGPNGTMAAGEFLINPNNLIALRKMAPAGWSGKNVEVVLGTEVISGVSGPPEILATHFW